jgi:hypothetical protein
VVGEGKGRGLTKDGMERGSGGGRIVVVGALGKPMRAVHALSFGQRSVEITSS